MSQKPATLEHFRKLVQAVYRDTGRDFRLPDDDWPSLAMFVQTPDGVELAGVPDNFLEHGWQKQLVREALAASMRHVGAFRYCLVVNVHGAALDRDARGREIKARIDAEELRVEDLPEAREYLWLVVGDAELEEVWQSEIRRDGRRPPTLSPWRDLSNDPETRMISGRFTGFSEALR